MNTGNWKIIFHSYLRKDLIINKKFSLLSKHRAGKV